jgi:hypothetical protein
MYEFNPDYSKRGCSLPPGCKDLIDVLRLDPKANWKTFFDSYWRLIYDTALKAGLTEGEAREVIQELMLDVGWKVLKLGFDPTKGWVKGWVIDFTRCRIIDKLSKRGDKAD